MMRFTHHNRVLVSPRLAFSIASILHNHALEIQGQYAGTLHIDNQSFLLLHRVERWYLEFCRALA